MPTHNRLLWYMSNDFLYSIDGGEYVFDICLLFACVSLYVTGVYQEI